MTATVEKPQNAEKDSAPTTEKHEKNTTEKTAVGHDDYSLSRVPMSARYHWGTMAVQRFGMLSALAQFGLSVSLGLGMRFWDAMFAVLLGSVLLEIVTIFTGIAGQREGMSTSLIARWSGFGTIGAALVGLVLSVSLVGWFGFQNEVFANGLHAMPGLKHLPLWSLALLGGALVTLIVVYGMKWMNWVAYITVPAFLILVTYTFVQEVRNYSIGELMSSAPPGTPISLAVGTTMVAGGFIAGAIFTPDMSRFNRSAADVVKQTVIGVTLGEFYVAVLGVLLAHGVKSALASADPAGAIISILQGGTGIFGLVVLCMSVVKVNDWNLYPSSLGIVNALDAMFKVRISRVPVALVLGLLGSIVSALGFAQYFTDFLGILGMLFPPIAAIMIADYFVLKTHRKELDESRENGFKLPDTSPVLVPAGLVAWVVGALCAFLFNQHPEWLTVINVPSIISLVVAFLVYWALGACGLAKGVGVAQTYPEPSE